MKIINRLRQILKMDNRSKLEEEREQQVPSSPTIQPPSPVPGDKTSAATTPLEESDSSPTQVTSIIQRSNQVYLIP